jgi:hypothetical protein
MDEIGELDLADGPHPVEGRSDPDPDDRKLGQRRIDDASRPVLLVQPLRRPKDAATRADVLANEEDALVARHLSSIAWRMASIRVISGMGIRPASASA